MAASDSFKQQTEYLVDFLLGKEDEDDEPELCFRAMGTREEPDEEKQAISALGRRLRELGDLIDKEHLDSFTGDFQKLAAQQAVDQACKCFSDTVHNIFKEWTIGKELKVEQNLLKISVSLGMQVAKETPNLAEEIGRVMKSFINTRLESWVTGPGGWANIDID